MTAWLAMTADTVPHTSAITALKADAPNTNGFLLCSLLIERQNTERFPLPSESEYRVKELAVKGAPPRSHEPSKKHFTDSQIAAQMTADPAFALVILKALQDGTKSTRKNMMIVYNRYPYHGTLEYATFLLQSNQEYKGARVSSFSASSDAHAVVFAKQHLKQKLFEAFLYYSTYHLCNTPVSVRQM